MESVEVNVRGTRRRLPAIDVGDARLYLHGRLLRVAAVYQERFRAVALVNPGDCIAELRGLGGADIFAFSQRLTDTQPRYSYPMEWESVAVAHTDNFERWWQSLPQTVRKNVRKCEKSGVEIRVESYSENIVQGIAEIDNATPLRQGRRNYNLGKDLSEVRRAHAPFADRSDYICAYLGMELIGWLKIVYAGDIASTVGMAAKPKHYSRKAANALIAKAVEVCAERRIRCLRYGQWNYGNKRGSSLQEFKSSNGFVEVLLPRYYVPLSSWGHICIRLGLHRGMIGVLPTDLVSMVGRARSRWHGLRRTVRNA